MRNYFIILCLLFFVSCEMGPTRSDKMPSSQDDKVVLNGLVKYYDNQRRLSSEVNYRDGLKHGITRIYYPSGAISDEVMYQYDQKHGYARKFHKNGNIYSLTLYVEGKREGVQKKFYSHGSLWAEIPYHKGEVGIGLVEYDRNGTPRTSYPYIEIQKFYRKGKVLLHVYLSNHSKNVVFYQTQLIDDKYLPQSVTPVLSECGIARLEIPLKSDQILDTTLSIVAKYRTLDHNIYITHRDYHLVSRP